MSLSKPTSKSIGQCSLDLRTVSRFHRSPSWSTIAIRFLEKLLEYSSDSVQADRKSVCFTHSICVSASSFAAQDTAGLPLCNDGFILYTKASRCERDAVADWMQRTRHKVEREHDRFGSFKTLREYRCDLWTFQIIKRTDHIASLASYMYSINTMLRSTQQRLKGARFTCSLQD